MGERGDRVVEAVLVLRAHVLEDHLLAPLLQLRVDGHRQTLLGRLPRVKHSTPAGVPRGPSCNVRAHDHKQRPDRNLALELVRVTEAAALAAAAGWAEATRTGPTAPPSTPCASCSTPCRWTASSSSARARRTKRRCCSTASTSATARPPQTDIAVDPIDGTSSPRSAAATPSPSSRSASGARCSTRARASTWSKIAVGPECRRRRSTSRDGHAEPALGRQGQGRERPRPHRRHPRPRPPRGPDRRGPRQRRPHQAHPRRRRRRRHRHRVARLPASTSCSASAARPRASSPPPR